MKVGCYKLTLLFSLLFFPITWVNSQCPQLFDGTGNPSANPYWIDCFGGNFSLNIQSPNNIGAWTIDWGDGSPIDNGASLIPPAFINHIYTATIDTFIVTFTETGSGCVIQGVVVMEEPSNASIQIPVGGVTQACAPAILDFINSSTDVSPTTVFTWDFGDGSPLEVYDYTNVGQTIQHQYLPGTVNCNTTVTLFAENYCNTQQGGASVATFNPIQIWDIDDAAIQASNILLCYPDTIVTFDNVTNRNCFAQGNTFQRQEFWNFGNYWGTGSDSTVGWQPWPPTFPMTIAYPGLGAYDVMLVDSSFCGLDTAFITINIVPPPTAIMTLSDDTICAGESVTAFNMSTGGANSFDWNFGDGSGWQTAGPGNATHSYSTPGDYTISLVANIVGGTASCTDTVTLNVHVLPSPTATILNSGNVGCDTLTVLFTDGSTNAVQWFWDFGNGNTSNNQNPAQQFYSSSGNYAVSLTVTSINGCVDATSTIVNVYESPVIAFLPTSVCQNELAQFTDLSTSAPGDPIISWFWNFDDGNTSISQNPTNTYLAIGNYDVSLLVSTAFCSASDTVQVTVEPVPTAAFNMTINSGCTPLDVTFSNTSTGAVNYLWDFGDGTTSNLANPNHIFINPSANDTNYIVQLVAGTTFGCTDTTTMIVTVFAGALADFSHNGLPGCAPLAVDFTNLSSGATSYLWDFDDGNTSTATDPSHTYVNLSLFIEVYDVELIAISPNGCSDTTNQSITVYPVADFTFTSLPDSGCSPLSVMFPSVIGAVSYAWDFGDGNTGTGPTPTHVYTNSTTNNVQYTVELIAISAFGCVDTSYGSVLVHPNPTAQIQLPIAQGCPDFTAQIQNLSTGAVNYYWDYGDGNTSTNASGTHSYVYTNSTGSTVSYTLQLIAETVDGCTDTAFQIIDVYPEVISAFTSDTVGCSPLTVNFVNGSTNGASYQWDFGDGIQNFTSNPSHIYFNNGSTILNFVAQLIAISPAGCRDTSNQTITVYPEPQASFVANPLIQTYPNTLVTLINNTPAGPWTYEWQYGDGIFSNLQSPGSHNYSTWGIYDIELIVSTPYCSDTAVITVEIEPPLPIPNFSGSGEGCSPLTISFTDSSQYVDTYLWDFGDGNTSTQQNPTYTYYGAGTYSVTLYTTGPGGLDSLTKVDSVIVHERATAFFTHAPSLVYVPSQPVQFYNLSSDANQYYWDFGDGTLDSVNFSPFHYYTNAGLYDVTLIATNQFGCADTFLLPAAVQAENGGDVVFPNAFTPSEDGPSNGYYDPMSLNNDVFFPIISGADEYHLEIFSRWGELIFESFDPLIGWDGYYRDQLVQQDVYVWKVRVKFSDGRVVTQAGDVTLLR